MLNISKRLEELESEVHRMKLDSQAAKTRLFETEQDICEIAVEFCRKYDLPIPERLAKQMESHS